MEACMLIGRFSGLGPWVSFQSSLVWKTSKQITRDHHLLFLFFPTCQVRVVRFYVSLFSFSPLVVLYSSFLLLLLSSSSSSDLNCDPVSSVWRAGPQPRAREFSVACRTPTAILRVQCGVPDPIQCGVPDPNRELVSSVWRAGPQLWWKGLVVVAERVCQTGKSHSTGHDCASGRSFTQRAPCLSSRIDWQVGSQRCFHVGALAELASVWLSANFLTSYSAFGFNRLSAERSVGIRDGWTLWRSTDMFDAFCLSYWYVDRWYPDMIWHVWCKECF